MTSKPIRVQFNTACQILDISRESLRHIIRTDKSFARPIKMGESKQSPVFFDYAELMEWHEKQKLNLRIEEV
ncbi:transcriptional regulator [Acinetobacter rudis]|uniref:Transcriptional regulator n=1 Tax=Acinetobacter rudis TaxID=632955 RepID=A0AAW8J8N6_9GAMM|nr:transcriptional regulator [Acinetobacter rudis]MDQ8935061.1 transcriptional regulator [Acinetobacter rudis]MDQ9017384.1 transcriptional regulator [Acinetobacter rudis]